MIFNNINTCNSQFSNVTKNSHISRREHLELLLKHVRVKTFTGLFLPFIQTGKVVPHCRRDGAVVAISRAWPALYHALSRCLSCRTLTSDPLMLFVT